MVAILAGEILNYLNHFPLLKMDFNRAVSGLVARI
jgi:hypothetical protein